MGTSFYVLVAVFGALSALNLFGAIAQKKSKFRTFGIWFNGLALLLIITALIISLIINGDVNLPWWSYMPIAAGIIGGLVGGYFYKKAQRKKRETDR